MTRYQDDFYDAVNGEWEKTAVIPDDKPRTTCTWFISRHS